MFRRKSKSKLRQKAAEEGAASSRAPDPEGAMSADTLLRSIAKHTDGKVRSGKSVEVFDAGLMEELQPPPTTLSVDKDALRYQPKEDAKNALAALRGDSSNASSGGGGGSVGEVATGEEDESEREPTQFSSFLRRGKGELRRVSQGEDEEEQESALAGRGEPAAFGSRSVVRSPLRGGGAAATAVAVAASPAAASPAAAAVAAAAAATGGRGTVVSSTNSKLGTSPLATTIDTTGATAVAFPSHSRKGSIDYLRRTSYDSGDGSSVGSSAPGSPLGVRSPGAAEAAAAAATRGNAMTSPKRALVRTPSQLGREVESTPGVRRADVAYNRTVAHDEEGDTQGMANRWRMMSLTSNKNANPLKP